ncbi:hypothetical protein DNTS_006514 [Danionella cerebrum]|uniref:Uncharacterized protein n=1 Tax=Danionella cerebrum TaxID=2873325 RepID=A0A553MZF7_9TELE|nr:hypothetical protein DNTS_006514 [Danionella translucida]
MVFLDCRVLTLVNSALEACGALSAWQDYNANEAFSKLDLLHTVRDHTTPQYSGVKEKHQQMDTPYVYLGSLQSSTDTDEKLRDTVDKRFQHR